MGHGAPIITPFQASSRVRPSCTIWRSITIRSRSAPSLRRAPTISIARSIRAWCSPLWSSRKHYAGGSRSMAGSHLPVIAFSWGAVPLTALAWSGATLIYAVLVYAFGRHFFWHKVASPAGLFGALVLIMFGVSNLMLENDA